MKIDITSEITFKTARSGGKGGQNVNKVESMVEGRWHIENSSLLSETQQQILLQKLSTKITTDGFLLAKSQESRTQLANKEIVIKKLNIWVNTALIIKKSRIATNPSKQAREQRILTKKTIGLHKEGRRKINPKDY